MMANLVAESGGSKGQLSNLAEALCRGSRIFSVATGLCSKTEACLSCGR